MKGEGSEGLKPLGTQQPLWAMRWASLLQNTTLVRLAKAFSLRAHEALSETGTFPVHIPQTQEIMKTTPASIIPLSFNIHKYLQILNGLEF